MAISAKSKILASDVSGAVKSFSVSGKTVTYTTLGGTTGTFTTQDTNTTYTAGTGISISSNKISCTVSAGNSTQQIFTESGTFTTPKAGVYTFMMMGGGQGGRNAPRDYCGGNGGHSGKFQIISLYLAASTSCTITVGAGGAEGGNSSVKANNITYTTAKGEIISYGGNGAMQYSDDTPSTSTTASENGPFGGTGGALPGDTYYGRRRWRGWISDKWGNYTNRIRWN